MEVSRSRLVANAKSARLQQLANIGASAVVGQQQHSKAARRAQPLTTVIALAAVVRVGVCSSQR